jgi:hypothetical protein
VESRPPWIPPLPKGTPPLASLRKYDAKSLLGGAGVRTVSFVRKFQLKLNVPAVSRVKVWEMAEPPVTLLAMRVPGVKPRKVSRLETLAVPGVFKSASEVPLVGVPEQGVVLPQMAVLSITVWLPLLRVSQPVKLPVSKLPLETPKAWAGAVKVQRVTSNSLPTCVDIIVFVVILVVLVKGY